MRINHESVERNRSVKFSDEVWGAIDKVSKAAFTSKKQILQQSFMEKYPESLRKSEEGDE